MTPLNAQANYDVQSMAARNPLTLLTTARCIDEFCYRFNRLKYPENIFHNLIKKMIGTGPLYLQKSQIV
jgi:hypothetical protein